MGGIRIVRITSSAEQSGSNLKIKHYQYFSPGTQGSSGVLMAQPKYSYAEGMSAVYNGNPCNVWYVNVFGASTSPLGTAAQGGPVGYSLVTELEGENGENGKTEYYYRSQPELPPGPPFVPSAPNIVPIDNGLLREEISYKRLPGTQTFKKVKDSVFEYAVDDIYSVKGAVVRPYGCGMNRFGTNFNPQVTQYPPREIVKYYDNKTYWTRKTSVTEKIFNQDSEDLFTQSTTTYTYGSSTHRQPIKISTAASDGRVTNVYYSYPSDYTGASTALSMMATTLHVLNAPVETFTTISDVAGANERVTGGNYTEYALGSSTGALVLPQRVAQLELTAPLSRNTFSPSTTTNTLDGHYVTHQSFEYEPTSGNIRTTRKPLAAPVTYQWGYQNELPIASFINAVRTPAYPANLAIGNEASYLGFEDSVASYADAAVDYWSKTGIDRGICYLDTRAHTGSHAWRVGPAIPVSTILGPTRIFSPDGQTRRYRFSAWVKTESTNFLLNAGRLSLSVTRKDGTAVVNSTQEVQFGDTQGQWRYLEVVIDLNAAWQQLGLTPGTPAANGERLQLVATTSNVSGNSGNPSGFLVDDLRFEPVDGQTITYTYDALSQQPSSSSDANNQPTYYEYDGLQRLKLARDYLGNILKHYTYHYQQ